MPRKQTLEIVSERRRMKRLAAHQTPADKQRRRESKRRYERARRLRKITGYPAPSSSTSYGGLRTTSKTSLQLQQDVLHFSNLTLVSMSKTLWNNALGIDLSNIRPEARNSPEHVSEQCKGNSQNNIAELMQETENIPKCDSNVQDIEQIKQDTDAPESNSNIQIMVASKEVTETVSRIDCNGITEPKTMVMHNTKNTQSSEILLQNGQNCEESVQREGDTLPEKCAKSSNKDGLTVAYCDSKLEKQVCGQEVVSDDVEVIDLAADKSADKAPTSEDTSFPIEADQGERLVDEPNEENNRSSPRFTENMDEEGQRRYKLRSNVACSKEEDEMLKELVNRPGGTVWKKIGLQMKSLTGKECRDRWHYHLAGNIASNKDHGCTEEEERVLEEAVSTYGENWPRIAPLLPGRSEFAVEYHYKRLLLKRKRKVDDCDQTPAKRNNCTSLLENSPPATSSTATSSSASTPASVVAFKSQTSGVSEQDPAQVDRDQQNPELINPGSANLKAASIGNVSKEVLQLLVQLMPDPWVARVSTHGAYVLRWAPGIHCAVQRAVYAPFDGSQPQVSVHSRTLPPSHELYSNSMLQPPVQLSEETASDFVKVLLSAITTVQEYKLCLGIETKDFVQFYSRYPSCRLDENLFCESDYPTVWRHVDCAYLVKFRNKRCKPCQKYLLNFKSVDYRRKNFKSKKEEAKAKVSKAEDSDTKDNKTKHTKRKDIQTENSEIKDSKTKDSKTRDSKTRDSKGEDCNAGASETEASKVEASKTEASKAGDGKAEDAVMMGNQKVVTFRIAAPRNVGKAKDSVEASKTKDSKAEESKSKNASMMGSGKVVSLYLTTPISLSKINSSNVGASNSEASKSDESMTDVLNEDDEDEAQKDAMIQERIPKLVATESLPVDKQLALALESAFVDSEGIIKLIWEEQEKVNAAKKGPAVEWHPLALRWALKKKSLVSACGPGFIRLTPQRTLYEYCTAGVEDRVVKRVGDEIGQFDDEFKKYCVLVFDEMCVVRNIVYHKATGRITGYVNLDGIEDEISELKEELALEDWSCAVATSMLTFFVKGVAGGGRGVVAGFATGDALTVDELHTKTWDVIWELEVNDVRIIALVGDGSALCQAFFNRHTPITKISSGVVFDSANIYADGRPIFFFTDTGNVLKLIRNCFANSGAHKKTRLLMKDGEHISWGTIVKIFHAGDNRCPKLTSGHVFLKSHSVTEVFIAAQVMSKSVADCIEQSKIPKTFETVKFIRYVNNFYDCLNGTSEKSNNVMLLPYRHDNDPRFDFLMRFLHYLEEWKMEVDVLPISEAEKQKRKLSSQTLIGIERTVRAFIAAVRFLLDQRTDPGSFIMARIFQQDDGL